MQPKSLDKATELFDRADTNGDGKLSLKELAGVLKSASQEYSHLAEHVRFLDGCGQLDTAIMRHPVNIVRESMSACEAVLLSTSCKQGTA